MHCSLFPLGCLIHFYILQYITQASLKAFCACKYISEAKCACKKAWVLIDGPIQIRMKVPAHIEVW